MVVFRLCVMAGFWVSAGLLVALMVLMTLNMMRVAFG